MTALRSYVLVVLSLWSVCALPQAPPEAPVFRHIDAMGAQGLSNPRARALLQLPDGRLAVRTTSGVNLYNGARFTSVGNPSGPSARYPWAFTRQDIYNMYYDARQGLLWLASPDYLSALDVASGTMVSNVSSRLATYGISPDQQVDNLWQDPEGTLWFQLRGGELVALSDNHQSSLTHRYTREAASRAYPAAVTAAHAIAYVLYDDGLLLTLDKASGQEVSRDNRFLGSITPAYHRLQLIPGSQKGELWLMHDRCLYHRPAAGQPWTTVAELSGASNFFTSLTRDSEGNLWMGSSWSGLRCLETTTNTMHHYYPLAVDGGGEVRNDIQCLLSDNQGGLWVGTLWDGICYYHPRRRPFTSVTTPLKSGQQHADRAVRSLLPMDDGTILVGTSDSGLLRYNGPDAPPQEAFPSLLPSDIILCLQRDPKDGSLWVGTYLNGFYHIASGQTRHYSHFAPSSLEGWESNIARALYRNPADGKLYVSVANSGIGVLDEATGQVELLHDRYPETLGHRRDVGICGLGAEGRMAVYGEEGLYLLDPLHQPAVRQVPELEGAVVNDVLTDSRGLLWVCTDRGIYVMDSHWRQQEHITAATYALPSDLAVSIIEDDDGCIWVATNSGISHIKDIRNGKTTVTNYTSDHGLNAGSPSVGVAARAKDGSLYVGAMEGFYAFHPKQMHTTTQVPAPVFSAFTVGTERRAPSKELTLNPDENFFSISFASPDYVRGSQGQYRYRLLGLDDTWRDLQTQGEGVLTFSQVPAGQYTLEVYAANAEHNLSQQPARLNIRIRPPWYATSWAYILYTCLLVAAVYLVIRWLYQRKMRRVAELQHKLEEQQREQLNQLKFRFFTNISHEFRTPLTLILTPLSLLIKEATGSTQNELKRIYANAEGLLDLINQLLDFRKLELGGEHLKLGRCKVNEFVRNLQGLFADVAREKGVAMPLRTSVDEGAAVWLDRTKLQRMLNNLYSNAMKFTPSGGTITTTVDYVEQSDSAGAAHPYLRLSVSDTGCGISPEDLSKIFKRFYQTSAAEGVLGSGIGLHMVKEYVDMHHGHIDVESTPGRGTTFILLLPRDLDIEEGQPEEVSQERPVPSAEATSDDAASSESAAKPRLLIVEDNREFRSFLAEHLSPDYTIVEASNGREGEAAALQTDLQPDIIVSDLMMPVMDGLEMCARLKQNIASSHIPLILLTARSSDEARIEGYRVGADSYIAKPFNFDVLQARLKMLLEQRDKRRQAIQHSPDYRPADVTITPLDEQLIDKAIKTVEQHMDNTEFGVDQLCDALATSRSQLYRKFQSMTGLTPSDFIRSVRLNRGAQLLRDSQYNISQIADLTGFSSVKYFTLHFREKFGLTPTAYRKTQGDRV